jgi:hypothetical protein
MANLMDVLPEATRAALRPILDPSERVIRYVKAVGCALVLTERNLVLVREGLHYRPRSGVQAWPLDRLLIVRAMPVRRRTGRVAIERSGQIASLFVAEEHWRDAEALIADLRNRIYLER